MLNWIVLIPTEIGERELQQFARKRHARWIPERKGFRVGDSVFVDLVDVAEVFSEFDLTRKNPDDLAIKSALSVHLGTDELSATIASGLLADMEREWQASVLRDG